MEKEKHRQSKDPWQRSISLWDWNCGPQYKQERDHFDKHFGDT